MAINFSNITLEVIDLSVNSTPDIYINQKFITFSRRVLEDLNYPQYVQYCLDATHKVFAIRSCKGNEAKATPFSKPRTEQTKTLSVGSKNLRDIIATMIPNYDSKKRYRIVGEYDSENRVMYYDMSTAEESDYRSASDKAE